MKELNFEQMESLNGGLVSPYCALLYQWVTTGQGYQGDYGYLVQTWMNNCVGNQ
jgi:hypothetical protein